MTTTPSSDRLRTALRATIEWADRIAEACGREVLVAVIDPGSGLRARFGEALEPVTLAATPAEVIARHMDGLNQVALVPSPAAFDALVDAVLPVAEAWCAEQAPSLLQGSPTAGSNEPGAPRERLAELESAIDWQTSCTSCARLLDSGYAETMRAENAEAAVARVRKLGENLRDGLTGHADDTQSAEIGRRILAALDQPTQPTSLGDLPYCERHRCWHAYPSGDAGCAAYDAATRKGTDT